MQSIQPPNFSYSAPYPPRPDQQPEAPPAEKVSLSKGAFGDGVGAAGHMTTTLTAAGYGGLMAAASAAVAGGPVGFVVGMVVGGGLGIWGGDKISDGAGKLGARVARHLGFSERTGANVGRAALALAVTAPLTLTLASATGPVMIGGAAVAGAFMLVGGIACKAVGWVADKLRH